MKIAYCFSGYLRTFERNDTLIKNIIEPNGGGDVFIHTWDKMNTIGRTWHGDTGLSGCEVDEIVEAKLEVIYDRKYLLVEKENEYRFDKDIMPYSMAKYSLMAVNNMRRHYEEKMRIKYDLVVFLRFDMKINTKYIFPEPEENTLYTLYNHRMTSKHVCDLFNHGRPEVMDIVGNQFHYISIRPDEVKKVLSPEYWLKHLVDDYKLTVAPIHLNASLLRTNNELHI